MNQLPLNFDATATLERSQPRRLLFRWRSPLSKHAGYTGAKVAQTRAGSKCARILAYVTKYGPQSRQQLAAALNLPVNSVCGRVGELLERHQVVEVDLILGPHGARQTRIGVRG